MQPTYRQIITLLLPLSCLAGCNRATATPDAPTTLVGSWQIVDQRLDDAGIEIVWTFDGSSIVVFDETGEIVSVSPYTIDETSDPHHITMQIRDVANESRPGIYAIANDILRLSFSVDGSPRPNSFEDGETLVLKKVPP